MGYRSDSIAVSRDMGPLSFRFVSPKSRRAPAIEFTVDPPAADPHAHGP